MGIEPTTFLAYSNTLERHDWRRTQILYLLLKIKKIKLSQFSFTTFLLTWYTYLCISVKFEIVNYIRFPVRLRRVAARRHTHVTVNATCCEFDPRSRKFNIQYVFAYFFDLILRQSASSDTQHAMPPEFGRKWVMECLNTRFPLPTLLREGDSAKLNKKHVKIV